MTVKHKTNSKPLIITMLNHAGHGVCYESLRNIDKSFAERNERNVITPELVIPSNIVSGGGFIHGAADNVDIIEETLDGRETTHATSMVLYQQPIHEAEDVDRIHAPEFPDLEQCPTKTPKPVFQENVENMEPKWQHTDIKDTVWLLSRLNSNALFEGDSHREVKDQDVPGRTPFNVLMSRAESEKTVIAHLLMTHQHRIQQCSI